MDVADWAAVIYALAVAGVIAFQIALALGAPWGSYAMGGSLPGRFPPRLRIAAVIQAAALAATIAVVLSRAGLVLPEWTDTARWLIWAVVALSAVALVLNSISRSAGERRIWVPVTLVMVVTSLAVALGG